MNPTQEQLKKLRSLYHRFGWGANGAIFGEGGWDPTLKPTGEPLEIIGCVEGCRNIGIYGWGRTRVSEKTKEEDAHEAALILAEMLNLIEDIVDG